MPQIVVVMGSDADLPVLEPAFAVLRSFPVAWEARVISAHRNDTCFPGNGKGTEHGKRLLQDLSLIHI